MTSAHSVSKPVPEPQKLKPQVGLDRDRRPAELRIEVGAERFEEHRVDQETVDRGKPRRKAPKLVWEQCFPQTRLWVYLGTQHGGSNRFSKGW